MPARLGFVEGWAVTHDGETLKTGFQSDFEAVAWLHRRHSYSVDHAVKHEGYDVVLVRDGRVVYSYRKDAMKGRPGMGAHRPRGSEGTAYIDKQGGRFVVRWWSDDERRYYTVKTAPTLEEAERWAKKEGFRVVVAEPHGRSLGKSGHPKPVWPKFVDAYLEAAIWSSSDEHEVPFDRDHTIQDFAQVSIDQAVAECNDFIKANRKDLEAVGDEEQHGHDFWLTRNHHGAGFWDRDYPKPISDRLTAAAHAAGERWVYKGDDGKLYFG